MQARVSGRAGMHIATGLLVYYELGTGDCFTFSVRELLTDHSAKKIVVGDHVRAGGDLALRSAVVYGKSATKP